MRTAAISLVATTDDYGAINTGQTLGPAAVKRSNPDGLVPSRLSRWPGASKHPWSHWPSRRPSTSRYERVPFLCFLLSVRHDSGLTRCGADLTRPYPTYQEGARNLLPGSPPVIEGAGAIIAKSDVMYIGSRFWRFRRKCGEEGGCRYWAVSGYLSGKWISGALGPDCLSITAHLLLDCIYSASLRASPRLPSTGSRQIVMQGR
jgi:hypothetical protein